MNESINPLNDLKEIRSIMERSSRFISLSGLSGVFAGIFALIGAFAAHWYLGLVNTRSIYESAEHENGYLFFFTDAILVVILAFGSGLFFTIRQAKRKGQNIWDRTSQRLLINTAIPMVVGGLFCSCIIIPRTNISDCSIHADILWFGFNKWKQIHLNGCALSWLCRGSSGITSVLFYWVRFIVLDIGVWNNAYYLWNCNVFQVREVKNIIINLNKAFENRIRLGIMSILMVHDWVDFSMLKETLDLTDGNLASHLSALEKLKYIDVRKSFIGKKPNTSYTASKEGKKAFQEHLDALEHLIKKKDIT